jgi:hypothetical protein
MIPFANQGMIRFHAGNRVNDYLCTPTCNYGGRTRGLSTCLLVAELNMGKNVKLGLRFKVMSRFPALQLL